MLRPQPSDQVPQAAKDRRTIEGLRRLLNRAEAKLGAANDRRVGAEWGLILERNKAAALQEENERLRAEVRDLAGEVEELRARLAQRRDAMGG